MLIKVLLYNWASLMRATLNNHWLVVFLFNMEKLYFLENERSSMSPSTEGSQWLWGEIGSKTTMAPYLPCTGLQCQLQVSLTWECTVTNWCSLQCSPFTSPQSQLNSEMTVTPLYFDTIPCLRKSYNWHFPFPGMSILLTSEHSGDKSSERLTQEGGQVSEQEWVL